MNGRETRSREMNGREARDGEIRGGRQYRFMENFAYSREAGTKGEEQAAKESAGNWRKWDCIRK